MRAPGAEVPARRPEWSAPDRRARIEPNPRPPPAQSQPVEPTKPEGRSEEERAEHVQTEMAGQDAGGSRKGGGPQVERGNLEANCVGGAGRPYPLGRSCDQEREDRRPRLPVRRRRRRGRRSARPRVAGALRRSQGPCERAAPVLSPPPSDPPSGRSRWSWSPARPRSGHRPSATIPWRRGRRRSAGWPRCLSSRAARSSRGPRGARRRKR